jgi:hypothetical protein
VKSAARVLLAILLCSCTGQREGGETAETGHLHFLDRSDPLVKHTFEVMEKRAQRSELREALRAEGRRVCEEGESRTSWPEEECKVCWCERGVLYCRMTSVTGCPEPADSAKFEREKARHYRELREMHRNRGRRVCEEGEHGTSWQEGCDTCWCEAGLRSCTTHCAPPPISALRIIEQPPRDSFPKRLLGR